MTQIEVESDERKGKEKREEKKKSREGEKGEEMNSYVFNHQASIAPYLSMGTMTLILTRKK